jgi:Fic family protein
MNEDIPMDTITGIFRQYQYSHPWITFEVDLREAGPKLWLLLGEAASKCEHVSGVPLRTETATKLHQIYMVKGVLATTAIEGNTLTEEQARQVIEGSLELPKSQEYLATEILNIVSAVDFIVSDVAIEADLSLTSERIHRYNSMVLKDLELEDGVIPGVMRTYPVNVGGIYQGAPAEDCEELLARLIQWIDGPKFVAPPDETVHYAILKAILAHLYIAWIHPYGDGNGRSARLVEFHLLVGSGVPTPAAHLLSNHYNQTKNEYYRRLHLASKNQEGVIGFINYALQGFVDGLKGQLQIIQDQQIELVWNDFVDQRFGPSQSPANLRRRRLIVDLGHANRLVPKGELKKLSPQLEFMYENLTEKALSRDLNSPVVRDCIEEFGGSYRAMKEIVLSFLPVRAH